MTLLKNYTTKIPAHITIAEIEQILLLNGARGIMKEYEEGAVESLVFTIPTEHGEIAFKLPCQFKKILERLKRFKRDGKLNKVTWKQLENQDHSQNVGWRIIKDWVAVQVSLINIDIVSLEQIFLPYAYDVYTKQTLFEKIKDQGFKLLKEGF